LIGFQGVIYWKEDLDMMDDGLGDGGWLDSGWIWIWMDEMDRYLGGWMGGMRTDFKVW